MADELDVETDEDVVDERIVKGSLIAPFVWISVHTWGEMVSNLSVELRLEVERACEIEGNCVVLPRMIWVLAKALAKVQSIQH